MSTAMTAAADTTGPAGTAGKAALLLLAASLLPMPLIAAATQPPTPSARTMPTRMDTLLDILLDEPKLMAVLSNSLDASMKRGLTGNPGAADMLALYPGLPDYIVSECRGEILALFHRELPSLRQQLADLLASRMTASEIDDLATFFSTPTGRKIYMKSIDSAGASAASGQNGADLAAQKAAFGSLTKEDIPALLAFGRSTASKKLQAIGPEMGAVSAAWGERIAKENRERLETLGAEKAIEYIAAQNAKAKP